MLPQIKLIIEDDTNIIETVSFETSTQPADLVKSLEVFQKTTNLTLTKIIEQQGYSGDDMDVEAEDDSDDEKDLALSPKKKKMLEVQT